MPLRKVAPDIDAALPGASDKVLRRQDVIARAALLREAAETGPLLLRVVLNLNGVLRRVLDFRECRGLWCESSGKHVLSVKEQRVQK